MGPKASRPEAASFAFLLPLQLWLSDISARSLPKVLWCWLRPVWNLSSAAGTHRGEKKQCRRPVGEGGRTGEREGGKWGRGTAYIALGLVFVTSNLWCGPCEQSFVESCSPTDVRQWWKEAFCFVLSHIQHFAHKVLLEKLYTIPSCWYRSPGNCPSASGIYTSVFNFV